MAEDVGPEKVKTHRKWGSVVVPSWVWICFTVLYPCACLKKLGVYVV